MNRLFLVGTITILAITVLAEIPLPVNQSKPIPGKKFAKLNSERFTGGRVRKANSASGKFVFLNAQKLVPSNSITSAFVTIEKTIHPIYEIKDIEKVSLLSVEHDIKQANGKLGVAIVDENGLPALLTAPEDGWAIINVRALCEGDPTTDVLASRTRKEILRAFALVSGCTFMARGQVVLRDDIRVPSDLDLITDETYGIEAMAAIQRNMPIYGVTPWREVTYKKACQEGWAPQPTNDVQKAIWDKVHSIPDKPIKITYGKGKQKPVVK